MAVTRIRRIYLRDLQQFRRCVIDLRGPDGRAVDRVCFIGRNGTGKSTLLKLLTQVLQAPWTPPRGVTVEYEHDGRRFLVGERDAFDVSAIDELTIEGVTRLAPDKRHAALAATQIGTSKAERLAIGLGPLPARDLVVYCPAETQLNVGIQLNGMPETSLSAALGWFREEFRVSHVVSPEHLAPMWSILIYLVKRRENDRQEFELRPENLQKTKAQLIREFDTANPAVLDALASLWNRILAPAGLEFDASGAKVPIQLTENLEAWVRLKSTKEPVPYAALSTGIRNFLFRIGHLFLLYFNRPVDRGFVLVDEPEDSLFPDFLFDLMRVYEDILRDPEGETRTQLFMATHSPIVAAQFEPYERVVLEWNDDGSVTAGKGTAPKGDDPNDLLRKDFHLDELMGDVGQQSWQRYLELRRQIRRATDAEKPGLVEEAASLAQAYSFVPPEPGR